MFETVVGGLRGHVGVTAEVGGSGGTHDVVLLFFAHFLHDGLFGVLHDRLEECDGTGRGFGCHLIGCYARKHSAHVFEFIQL